MAFSCAAAAMADFAGAVPPRSAQYVPSIGGAPSWLPASTHHTVMEVSPLPAEAVMCVSVLNGILAAILPYDPPIDMRALLELSKAAVDAWKEATNLVRGWSDLLQLTGCARAGPFRSVFPVFAPRWGWPVPWQCTWRPPPAPAPPCHP